MTKLTLLLAVILPFCLSAQSIVGIWDYDVPHTPSGDYRGELIIQKYQDSYEGEVISSGESAAIDFLYAAEDSFQATSDVSGWFVTITGNLVLDQLEGYVSIEGDLNRYPFIAIRKKLNPIINLIDANTQESIPYATILHDGNGIISNDEGRFSIKYSDNETELIVSAIGYKTDTIIVDATLTDQTLELFPHNYTLPNIEVKATGFSAKKIVEAAIKRIDKNYVQEAFNASLFFRHTSYTEEDSISYQSESMLDFYDSKGFQKRGWRNNVRSRYAQLKQARITTSQNEEVGELNELNRLWLSWAHNPLVNRDNVLNLENLKAYKFVLAEITEFDGKEVYVVEYDCTKLKAKYAGLPSLKYSNGKLFINKEDYAIIRMEGNRKMDDAYTGKHAKKRGNSMERNIIEQSSIDLYTKGPNGYYLDYSKSINNEERQITPIVGKVESYKGKYAQERQYFNVTTNNLRPLEADLFELETHFAWDPEYWDQFNFILKD